MRGSGAALGWPPMTERPHPSRSIYYPAAVALLALSVLVGFAFLPRMFPSTRSAFVGKPAPDFALEVLHNGDPGARIRLAELRGQPVVLDFWATWCKPCQIGAPALDRVYRKVKDKGVIVLGVNTNDPQGRRMAPEFAKAKDLSYPIVFDEGEEVAAQYGVNTLPTLVIVDKDGNVAAIRSGLVDEGDLEDLLQTAL